MKSRRQKISSPSETKITPGRPRASMLWLGLVVAVAPWIFWPWAGLLDPFETPKWVATVFGLVVFLGLLCWERNKIPPEGVTTSQRVLLIGAGAIVLGLILSSIFSRVPLLGLRVTIREGMFVLAAAAIASARPRRVELRWVIGCFLVSAALQSALALVQYFWLEGVGAIAPNLAIGRGARGSMIGTIGNPEYVAGWLAPALVISSIQYYKSQRSNIPLWNLLIPITLSLVAIFFSGGRGAIISAFVSVALAQLILFGSEGHVRDNFLFPLKHPVFGLFLLGLGFLAGIAYLFSGPARNALLPSRLIELTNFQSDSMRHRIGLYTVTTQMILENPALGVGPGRFGAAYGETQRRLVAEEKGIGYWAQASMMTVAFVGEAHCDPLQWWAEYGLLPIMGLSLMLAAALGKSRRVLRANPEMAALWGGLLTLALTMWVSFPLQDSPRAMLFWAMVGLLAGAESEVENENGKTKD